MIMKNKNQFTQLCVWPGVIVIGESKPEEHEGQIIDFEAWVANEFKGTRAKFAEEVKTLPTPGEPGTGGRHDIFFYVHHNDIGIFAVPRLAYGIRWWEDVIENESHLIYPQEVLDKYLKKETKEKSKPKVKLTGQDGNVFNLMGLCSRALKRAGQADKAKEMQAECMGSGSYDEALQIMSKYVEVC